MMYEQIKNQTLTLISEIISSPVSEYMVNGQSMARTQFLEQLRQTVEWCDAMTEKETLPVEMRSIGRSQ